MVRQDYVPDVGDVVWLSFDPRIGHEQSGHRPALVLTPTGYNRLRGMMVVCPMTSKFKGFNFEVVISRDPDSVVLADHIRSVDWRERRAVFKAKAPDSVVADVRAKLGTLLAI